MSVKNASAPIYVPGRTQQETERLQQYAGRVRAEVVSQHSYVVLPLMVRAWTRKD